MARMIRRMTALLLIVLLLLTACTSGMTATTMALRKTEGTVNIRDGKQKEIKPAEQLNLYDGYQVATQPVSYAWIDLDKVKLTKMDAESEIEIKKKRNDLEIIVNSGRMFFHIAEPLKDEESLNIRTSSMMVGIRGTCGWVDALNEEQVRLYVLEGTVACRCDQTGREDNVRESVQEDEQKNFTMQEFLRGVLRIVSADKMNSGREDNEGKSSSEVQENDDNVVYVSGGEMAELTFSPDGEAQISVSRFAVSDIPDYVMEELLEDEDLRRKIAEESGLEVGNWFSGNRLGDNGNESFNRSLDEGRDFSPFLEDTVYYGDPAVCRLTHQDAEWLADKLQQVISDAESRSEYDNEGGDFRSYAAFFDAGDGVPAIFFSSGEYGYTAAGTADSEGKEVVVFSRVTYQTVMGLHYDMGYNPDAGKTYLGNGYVFSGFKSLVKKDDWYRSRVLALTDGQIEVLLTKANVGVSDYFSVDEQAVTQAEYMQWVEQWAEVPSVLGYSYDYDDGGTCWGMVPAEEVLGVLNAYIGRK